ncbi:MAG: TrkH family potassium uptake protein [Pseudomonadota bacterium]
MNYQPILFVVGLLLSALGSLMLVPALFELVAGHPSWIRLLEAALMTLLCGAFFVLANRPHKRIELSLRETFLLTASCWLTLAAFASLPFLLTRVTTTTTDAFFEGISALTTTGATVLTGLEFTSKGILLWRAILQWVGGIGIIVMALTVLPLLRIGGMQLFHSEFSDRMEKILPRVSQITKAIFWTYAVLTLLCVCLLWLAGIDGFDAVCVGLTTVATGGMATSDQSVAHFKNPAVEIIMMVFMVIGAMTLLQFVRMLRGHRGALWQDGQTRTFLCLVALAPSVMTLWRWEMQNVPFLKALRESFFNTIAIMTTSGFTTTNYERWGSFAIIFFFILLFIGGCTGSTTSGIKILRVKIIYVLTKAQIRKLFRPHLVYVPTYNKQTIDSAVMGSVFMYLGLFVSTYAALCLGLSFLGLDFITSLSGAASAITNLGPGFGPLIGPSGTYTLLPTSAKWLLMGGMFLGRLELITLLILFMPSFWRD